jgi:hypothetical protein
MKIELTAIQGKPGERDDILEVDLYPSDSPELKLLERVLKEKKIVLKPVRQGTLLVFQIIFEPK